MLDQINHAIRDSQHGRTPFSTVLKGQDYQNHLVKFAALPRGPRLLTLLDVQYFIEGLSHFMCEYGFVECGMRWEISRGSGYEMGASARLSL